MFPRLHARFAHAPTERQTGQKRPRSDTQVAAAVAAEVAQDKAIQAAQAVLSELCETQERLRAHHHALSTILSRRFNSLVSIPAEVAGVSGSPRSTGNSLPSSDGLMRSTRCKVADVAAHATILESEMPKYRRLVDECERAKSKWDEREAARLAFLADLRRRGVFQEPVIAERRKG
jgi:hypothetical protein